MLLAGCRLLAQTPPGTKMSTKECQQPDFVGTHGRAPCYGGKGALSLEVGVRVPPRSVRMMSEGNPDESGGDSSHVRCVLSPTF